MGTHPSFGFHSFSKQIGLKPLLHLLVVLASPALLGIFPVTEPLLFGFRDDYLGHSGFLVWSPSSPHQIDKLGHTTIIYPYGYTHWTHEYLSIGFQGELLRSPNWTTWMVKFWASHFMHLYAYSIYSSRKKNGSPTRKKKTSFPTSHPQPSRTSALPRMSGGGLRILGRREAHEEQ